MCDFIADHTQTLQIDPREREGDLDLFYLHGEDQRQQARAEERPELGTGLIDVDLLV